MSNMKAISYSLLSGNILHEWDNFNLCSLIISKVQKYGSIPSK